MDGVTLFLLRQVGGWRENRFSMKSLVLFRNEVGDLITVLNLADLVWKERPSTPSCWKWNYPCSWRGTARRSG